MSDYKSTEFLVLSDNIKISRGQVDRNYNFESQNVTEAFRSAILLWQQIRRSICLGFYLQRKLMSM